MAAAWWTGGRFLAHAWVLLTDAAAGADWGKLMAELDKPLGIDLDRWGEGSTDLERRQAAAAVAAAPARKPARAPAEMVVYPTAEAALAAAQAAESPEGEQPAT